MGARQLESVLMVETEQGPRPADSLSREEAIRSLKACYEELDRARRGLRGIQSMAALLVEDP